VGPYDDTSEGVGEISSRVWARSQAGCGPDLKPGNIVGIGIELYDTPPSDVRAKSPSCTGFCRIVVAKFDSVA